MLNAYIELKTNNVLTLGKFDRESRGVFDVQLLKKGAKFEEDPFQANISIWYMKWRSRVSLNDAVINFIKWLSDTEKEVFITEVKSALKML